jgi:predicted RNA-binding Zn-ribbon protein involved in translation (DUF1610 family)
MIGEAWKWWNERQRRLHPPPITDPKDLWPFAMKECPVCGERSISRGQYHSQGCEMKVGDRTVKVGHFHQKCGACGATFISRIKRDEPHRL